MHSLTDTLKSIDNAILLFINGMHTPFLDGAMTIVSNRLTWIPLYVLLLWLVLKKFGKNAWLVMILCLAAVALSDQLASHLVKNFVMRYRPSHNSLLAPHLHLVGDYMGGLYGFASSHASNTFAVACFITFIMPQNKQLVTGLFFWACLVCYSRVYLGVHYPSDILGGAIIGFLSAWICYKIWVPVYKRLCAA